MLKVDFYVPVEPDLLAMIDELRQRMNDAAPTLREAMTTERLFSKLPTNSQASSESTQIPSPSGN